MAKSPDLEGFWRYQKSKNIFYYHKGAWIKKSQFLVGNKYYYFNKSGVLVTDSFRTFKNSKGVFNPMLITKILISKQNIIVQLTKKKMTVLILYYKVGVEEKDGQESRKKK